jgi:hypothetical protein
MSDDIWDHKADAVHPGDKKRDVSPLAEKTYIDEDGFTHYYFSKILFNNPFYVIPDDDILLFERFMDGGSRTYPSDGSVPCDVVAGEARKVLKKIVACSEDSQHPHYRAACDSLKDGKNALVRGTMKIYLDKFTTRDWRRKRFTDDIDFWCFNVALLEYALKKLGWFKNKDGEWEKKVNWINPETRERKELILFAANNLNQLLDFGAGSYLEGSGLKEIFDKKLKRGHDVDLSDIINIVFESHDFEGKKKEDWEIAWISFEEAANTRNARITSNIISFCRYSLAIADYMEKVGKAIETHHELIFDKNRYPDDELPRICNTSIHWENFLNENGPDATRNMLHEFLLGEIEEKSIHSRILREFVQKVLTLLNTKYRYRKVIFEITN